jgi:hypothetical protein
MHSRLRSYRPSGSMLVALCALFVALGGTSYAALTISGKNVKNNSLTSADVKNKSLLAKDFKQGQLPAGARGPQGPAGPAGQNGTNGTDGAPGAPGSGRAWAHVAFNGNVVESNTKGLKVAKNPGGGVGEYCVEVPFDPQNIQVTVSTSSPNDTVDRFARAGLDSGYGSCSTVLPGTNAFVSFRNGTTYYDTNFFVLVN